MTTTLDDLVIEYQQTKDSSKLVKQYQNFLNKYVSMIWYDSIDYTNHDLRCFLSCFITDATIRINLRRGDFQSEETMQQANEVLQAFRFKLRHHTWEELFHEAVIPFLICAKRYKQIGKSFEKYLYKTYKYRLKIHLNEEVKLDMLDHKEVIYKDLLADEEEDWDEKETPLSLNPQFDSGLELNNPNWIHGEESSEPFRHLKAHERFILAKYYYEDYTDKEIARMLPYSPKSIHRIRMRLKKEFHEMYTKGEMKWLRL